MTRSRREKGEMKGEELRKSKEKKRREGVRK